MATAFSRPLRLPLRKLVKGRLANPPAGGGVPRPSVYKLTKGVGTMTLSATQAGIFNGPMRLFSVEVLSVSGGSATVWANSVNSGTAMFTGLNTVGKVEIDKGLVCLLGLGVQITPGITVRIEYETYTAAETKEPVYAYGDDIWHTMLVSNADKAKARTQPCKVGGIHCYGAGGSAAVLYNNPGKTGEVVYSGVPVANAAVDIAPDKLCRNGLSVDLTGNFSLAIQVQ